MYQSTYSVLLCLFVACLRLYNESASRVSAIPPNLLTPRGIATVYTHTSHIRRHTAQSCKYANLHTLTIPDLRMIVPFGYTLKRVDIMFLFSVILQDYWYIQVSTFHSRCKTIYDSVKYRIHLLKSCGINFDPIYKKNIGPKYIILNFANVLDLGETLIIIYKPTPIYF